MKVTLKDQSGSFFDAESGFSLTRDEVAELGDDIGSLTQAFKQHGHIVEVEEKAAKEKAAKEKAQ